MIWRFKSQEYTTLCVGRNIIVMAMDLSLGGDGQVSEEQNDIERLREEITQCKVPQ